MIAPLIQYWREALRAFPVFGRRLIAFQLAFALLAGALLSPALAWLLDQLIRSTGDYAVSNYDLIGFFLSAKGLTFLALTATTAAALLYLELTGLLLISADAERPLRSLSVLRYALRRFPGLLKLGLFQVLGLGLVALPFGLVLLAIKSRLLGEHDINYYLYEQPAAWTTAVALAGVVGLGGGLVLLVVALRWLFALPLLLSTALGPVAVLRRSWQLTKGHLRQLLATLAGWWLCTGLAVGAAATILTWLAELLLAWAGLHLATIFFVVIAFLTLLLAIAFVSSVVTKGVNAILINRLFRELTDRTLTIPDDLTDLTPVRGIARPIRLAWLALLVAFLVMSVSGISWVNRLDFKEEVAITAHRGSSHAAPENTLSALRQAITDGADYAEIDVQTTRDGQVVILHDRDFMRLAGDPRRLEDLTLAEAQTIDIGSRFDAAFAEERLATLAEAIEVVRGKLRLNIELKYNRTDPDLAPAVVDLLREADFLDQCVITSLDFDHLQAAKHLEPALQIGLIVTQSVGNPARLPVEFLSVNTAAATDRLLSQAHQQGKAVHVWTVNDATTMTHMIEAGADNVITDKPAEMRQVLNDRAALSPAEKLALQMRRQLVD